jgi:hypothetical protein
MFAAGAATSTGAAATGAGGGGGATGIGGGGGATSITTGAFARACASPDTAPVLGYVAGAVTVVGADPVW